MLTIRDGNRELTATIEGKYVRVDLDGEQGYVLSLDEIEFHPGEEGGFWLVPDLERIGDEICTQYPRWGRTLLRFVDDVIQEAFRFGKLETWRVEDEPAPALMCRRRY